MIERQLGLAEEHVRNGERQVAGQHRKVTELERDGLDTIPSRRLLRTLQDMQALYVNHRDRLRQLLGIYRA